jgi:hypothetical protein
MRKSILRETFLATSMYSFFVFPGTAFAYLDPGTGSYILQLLIGFLFGALFMMKIFWNKIKGFFSHLFSRK